MPPPLVPLPLLFSLACSLQGPPVFLGRALAAPRVKLLEDPYQRPELQFFPLRKGCRAAGELIATFELIELDYSGRLEVRVPRPSWHELWIPLVILSGCPAPGNIEHGCVPGLPESLGPKRIQAADLSWGHLVGPPDSREH